MKSAKERAMGGVRQRFEQDAAGCWTWRTSINTWGYGQITTWGPRQTWVVHRLAWEAVNGPIPDGLTVDHICRNRACFNPRHLRLLTRSENGMDNGQARRTHCPHGHPYNDSNTYTDPRGWRQCRECRKQRKQRNQRQDVRI